jgi:hypothetical protein
MLGINWFGARSKHREMLNDIVTGINTLTTTKSFDIYNSEKTTTTATDTTKPSKHTGKWQIRFFWFTLVGFIEV